ncbi:MAG TPA: GAF domain-containing sensor histidine kinase, partial [Solirubrobacteraceae bacterium]|nr:GAF domain-containing sensor histidine kinase [Solirubrobacteraceae bacterium]
VWGLMATGSTEGRELPPGIEHRLAEFTELVGTAIANTQAREQLRKLAEEQSALRRVATLVAQGASPGDVFAAVAAEVAQLLGITLVVMCRYEPDNSATAIGAAGDHPFRPGTHWPLDGPSMLATVRQTRRPARIDDYSSLPGQVAEAVRAINANAGVSAPIIVDGEVWGAVSAGADSPLPPDTEERLSQFTDLVATAVSKTQASDELRRLAEEQSGLRRVATLVAQSAPPAEVFAAVAAEVSTVLDLPLVEMCRYETDGTATVIGAFGDHPFQTGTNWTLEGPSLTGEVKRTGRPARVDDYADVTGSIAEAAKAGGVHAGVGAPIVVDGKVWGVISAGGGARVPLLPDAEARLSQFTELVATAISNAQAREDLRHLVEEQAALRRVATLVAEGAEPEDIFALVAEEIARATGLEMVMIGRYYPEQTVTLTGAAGDHPFQPGTRWPLDGKSVSSQILDTGRPVSSDPYHRMTGTIAEAARSAGMRAGVGVPVIVDGKIWGNVTVGGTDRAPLPANTERRLTQFTELIATAVSNAQARQDLRRLVEEQAALRRIATLVAEGAPSQRVFDAVCEETGRVFGAATANLAHFTPDGINLTISGWSLRGVHGRTGTRLPIDGDSINAIVQRTGAPGRCDSYEHAQGEIAALMRQLGVRSEVGAPVVVDGEVWGVLIAGTDEPEPLAPGTEYRLSEFAELIATAVSNTQARQDLRRLVDEQAALRRIATLVARGAQSQTVFDAVCEETGRLFGAATVNLVYFTPEDFHLAVAGWSLRGVHVPAGTLLPLKGETIDTLVRRTAAPGRFDSYEHATGQLAALIRKLGILSEVGAPVVVDGEVWGVLIAGTDEPEPLAPGTEQRLASFAELIATAVSNTTARSELIASRARIVSAGDEQRRRVVRDLHDGAQQRLVHGLITLQLAQSEGGATSELRRFISDALDDTRRAIEELRELAHGLHPAVLTARGLAAAVEELADRAPVPVQIDIPEQRFPAAVESAAYFIAAEALTNVAKYANASKAGITVTVSADALMLEVDDDGIGGAVVRPGSGLYGLLDRVAALDGTLTVKSPPGAGTCLRAQVPLSPPGDREPVGSADVAHA